MNSGNSPVLVPVPKKLPELGIPVAPGTELRLAVAEAQYSQSSAPQHVCLSHSHTISSVPAAMQVSYASWHGSGEALGVLVKMGVETVGEAYGSWQGSEEAVVEKSESDWL